jgi:hypothetical protein
MRFCFVSTVRVHRTSTVLSALLCLAVALLVACGGRATPSTTPPINSVDLAVTGQTVTKARAAGNEVVVLEQRLNSIFENGPQRTLATLQSDGRTVRPYTPPQGWSVVDFAVHPSGNVSAILTTAKAIGFAPLSAAHGVVWDSKHSVLWALGGKELCRFALDQTHSVSRCTKIPDLFKGR